MDRLLYVIVFTTDLAATTRFYRDRIGLESAQDNPHWVDYRTGGARLGTMEIHPGMACEVEIALHVPDLETTVTSLRAAGVTFMGDIKTIPYGRLIHLRDPNGTLVSLYAPNQVPQMLDGPVNLTLMINADDFGATVAFYRDVLGLEVGEDEHDWVTFETGGTRLAVARRARGGDHPDHAAQKLVFGFEVPDLDAAAADMRTRGLRFSTAPTDADFGPYAEAVDPEGNVVVFREPAVEPALEEVLAEGYEDDGPARIAIRKPVQKQSKAVSRVVNKPDYKKPRKAAAGRPATKPAASARRSAAASTRGAGPAGTRLKPKTTRDPKRAKAKPASGRAKKASARVAAGKKRAVARVSKGRPVKKEATRGGRKR